MMQFALGQFSFGHFKNIVACLEIIWFSRHWLFCSSPATSCKAMLLTLGCFGHPKSESREKIPQKEQDANSLSRMRPKNPTCQGE